MIYYSNNGTTRDLSHATNVGWIGPSLTPLTNVNSGFRMYEVDTGDFSVYEAHTYYSDVSSFPSINTTETGARPSNTNTARAPHTTASSGLMMRL